jgi:hypothetical protein
LPIDKAKPRGRQVRRPIGRAALIRIATDEVPVPCVRHENQNQNHDGEADQKQTRPAPVLFVMFHAIGSRHQSQP